MEEEANRASSERFITGPWIWVIGLVALCIPAIFNIGAGALFIVFLWTFAWSWILNYLTNGPMRWIWFDLSSKGYFAVDRLGAFIFAWLFLLLAIDLAFQLHWIAK